MRRTKGMNLCQTLRGAVGSPAAKARASSASSWDRFDADNAALMTGQYREPLESDQAPPPAATPAQRRGNMQRSLTAVAFSVACALGAAPSAAQAPDRPAAAAVTPTRVVLVADPGMEDLVRRFIAELDSLKLEVVRAPDAESAPEVPELEQLAQEHAARVAVRVGRAGRAVDLWLVNPESHELVYRRVVAGGDPAVLVLRSLEILRGALIDLRAVQPNPPPPETPVTRPKPPPAPVSPPPSESAGSWLGLSAALIAPHAGRNLGGGVSLALHQRLASRFALHAELLAPLNGWTVEGEGGRARVWLGSATCAALVNPWGDAWLSPGLGLGLGALALYTRGEAEAGYEGTNELHAALFPHGRVELALKLGQRWRLRAALAAGFATPRPVLLFGEKREESWLNPVLISSFGAEVALP
jgi:hypothetical protein